MHYVGWEQSSAALTEALQEHAPIDGLLGVLLCPPPANAWVSQLACGSAFGKGDSTIRALPQAFLRALQPQRFCWQIYSSAPHTQA